MVDGLSMVFSLSKLIVHFEMETNMTRVFNTTTVEQYGQGVISAQITQWIPDPMSHCEKAMRSNKSDMKAIEERIKLKKPKLIYLEDHFDGANYYMTADTQRVCLYSINGYTLSVEVFSKDLKAEEYGVKILEEFKEFAYKEEKKEGGIWLNEMHWSGGYIGSQRRFITAPDWTDIQNNYTEKTRQQVNELMLSKNPTEYGKLVIWNGLPGTGKTYAIRSLMKEWSKTFMPCFISDPETFCENPKYFYSIPQYCVPPNSTEVDEAMNLEMVEDVEKKPLKPLVIFEDAAILLMRKERTLNSKIVNKLLNMTDGILGQGIDIVYLITFNESMEEIDGAFTRSGRCIAATEFESFTKERAKEWLKNKGLDFNPSGNMTLAEMYSKVIEQKKAKKN